MTDNHAADPETQIAPLPTQTLLIGAASGRRIGLINYTPAEPGEIIKLGPTFGPSGSEATVVKTRTVEADDGTLVHVLEVGRLKPGNDADQC